VQLIRNQQAVSSNLIIGLIKKQERVQGTLSCFFKMEYRHNQVHRLRVQIQAHMLTLGQRLQRE
jgi:hypothetical protein